MIRLEQLKQELVEKRQAFQQERFYRRNVELTLCPLYDQAGAAEAGAGGEATGVPAVARL